VQYSLRLGAQRNDFSDPRRAPQTDQGQSVMVSNPLGLGNWQLKPRSDLALFNKTGSDVHIAASTMAT
jgi:hypothetical protein